MKKLAFVIAALFILSGCSSAGIVMEDPMFRWGQPPTSQDMVGHIYTNVDAVKQETPAS